MTSLPSRLPPTESLVPMTPFSLPWLRRLRGAMGTTNGQPTLMTGFEISEEEHWEIQNATSLFRQRITDGPADRVWIAEELANLFAAFPAQDQSSSPPNLRGEAYFGAMGNAPTGVVREARLKFIGGHVPDVNRNFAPTPPVFAEVVRGILRPYRMDLADLETLTTIAAAFNPSPEERARVADGFGKLKAELPSGQARVAKSETALAKLAEENLRTTLRGLGKSPEEIEEGMNSLRDAPARPDGFTRPTR